MSLLKITLLNSLLHGKNILMGFWGFGVLGFWVEG